MANISATLCLWPRAIFSSRLSLAHVSKRSFASIIFILQKERTLLDDKAVLELKNPWQGKRRCKKRESMNMKIAMYPSKCHSRTSTFQRDISQVGYRGLFCDRRLQRHGHENSRFGNLHWQFNTLFCCCPVL